MQEDSISREHALGQLHQARERRDRSSERFEAARGSLAELQAFTDLQAALDQFAAREAWLAWADRDY